MSVTVCVGSFSIAVASLGNDYANIEKDAVKVVTNADSETKYFEYINQYDNLNTKTSAIELINGETQTYKSGSYLEYECECNEGTLYNVIVSYVSKEKQDVEISVMIDGISPFDESKSVKLPTYYRDGGNVRIDGDGNEFAPEQVIAEETIVGVLRDYTGEYEEPYLFYIPSGKHKISFVIEKGTVVIDKLSLVSPESVEKYSVKNDDILKSEKIDKTVTVEGEKAFLKSSASLIPMSDDSSNDVNPSSASKAVINYIGGSNWSDNNDTLEWKFNIDKSGYYRLGFIYRQNMNLGGVSYRHLKIDGVTPFKEAKQIKFKYDTGWQYMDFADDKDDYWVYLKQGEHRLSLSVTSGELTDINRRLNEVTADLGDLYIDITMVVGETVDISRSYELFNQIPDFNNRLKSASERLKSISADLETLQEKKGGSNVSTIGNAIETINKMYENPYSAHKYKSAYYSAYTNLSAMLGTITDMPLDIDRIFIIGSGVDFKEPTASFFESLSFGFMRFINSFISAYELEKNEDALTIWVNWGRDQTQVLDSLIQSDFVKNEKIPVNVKLVNATLIQAILAGNGPDVMLQMSRTEPVNLAMRGAILDLTEFEDYNQVMSRFTSDAHIPYSYNGGVYALPDTMNFYLLFARTDILEGLGLKIPETWQEFIYALTILQHNNLQVSLPYTQIVDSTTVNVGVGGLTLYPTMLLQNELELYNKELTQSTLTHESQIGVFTEWTELYTKYKVPITMDFYNRFRIGSAPLGIASYTLYTQLKAAAPEIEGRWSVSLIPGTVDKNGNVNHNSAGSGAGCAITKLCDNPDNAWKFLKWWTNCDTQLKYSESLESLLGPLGRVATANVEALKSMIWDDEMLEIFDKNINTVVQIPELPGGYYTARGIDQAFWNVVEQNENPTDMMLEWGKVVDGEIKRKRHEFAQ